MRAARLREHGGPDVFSVEEIHRPDPGPDEVLIEVAAAGVNPVDTYFRDGSYTPVELPFTPGVDVAGTVAAVGADVDGFASGDRVFGTGIGNAAHQGSYAEFATAPVDSIVQLPDGVDLVEAGGAGVVAGTAWRALIEHAELKPAERCLIHGGSGGVGHAAVQIAAATGAHVIATAAPAYHDRVESLGADAVFDYARDDLADAVRDESDGGVDVILDHRLDDYLQFDAEVAATGGRVVGIGENDPVVGFQDDGAARSSEVNYQFMILFNAPDIRRILDGVGYLMGQDDLSIEVAETYGLDEAADAQIDVMEESFLGKLVIVP